MICWSSYHHKSSDPNQILMTPVSVQPSLPDRCLTSPVRDEVDRQPVVVHPDDEGNEARNIACSFSSILPEVLKSKRPSTIAARMDRRFVALVEIEVFQAIRRIEFPQSGAHSINPRTSSTSRTPRREDDLATDSRPFATERTRRTRRPFDPPR